MAIILDETTLAAYQAQSAASTRAALIVSALSGTVICRVCDGNGVVRGQGTMAAPWATVSGSTITIGALNGAGFAISNGGVPDGNWYCEFYSGGRFVRGTFGVAGSGADFTWSLSSFSTGQRGTIGTAQLIVVGSVAGQLSAADFAYLGTYNVSVLGTEQLYSSGLGLRKVGTETRFVLHKWKNPNNDGDFVEFSIAGKNYGDTITALSRQWTPPVMPSGQGAIEYLWWNPLQDKLWVSRAADYPYVDTVTPQTIQTFSLEAGQTAATNYSAFTVENLPDRRAFTGATLIPSNLQATFNCGPYALGFGGYTSRSQVGGSCALGLSMYAISDPSGIANGGTLPATQVKTLGTRGTLPRGRRIWYGYTFTPDGGFSGGSNYNAPTGTIVGDGPINYTDGGHDRENPPTSPNYLPIPGAQYVSPDANGYGIWPSQGGAYTGGVFINVNGKSGFVAVGRMDLGRIYYMSSAGYSDYRMAEIHVFDLAQIAQVAAGTRSPDAIEPVSMAACPPTRTVGNGSMYFSAWDSVANRLYIFHHQANNPSVSKLHVYQLNA